MSKIILDLCGGTGAWSKSYKDAGYDVRVITLPDNDILTFEPPDNVYGILAAPPCTEFSIAKDHKLKRDLISGMKLVNACFRIIEKSNPKFWVIENPIGHLSKFIGSPQYTFQPWWFGDPWTKKTALWGTFYYPRQSFYRWEDVPKIPELYIRPGRTKPSIAFLHKSALGLIPQLKGFTAETDAGFRAITPPGFANAFFKANQ